MIIFKNEIFNVSTFLALAYNGILLAEGRAIEALNCQFNTKFQYGKSSKN